MINFPLLEIGKFPKLGPKYRGWGLYKIIKNINDLNYKISLTLNNKQTEDTFHIKRLKPYF